VKFSHEGGSINISLIPKGERIAVSITDMGIGIEADKISDIFEPFHQIDGSSTRKQGGTGLGLTLVQKILDAHGQKVEVLSTPGKGSSFTFLLDRV
jgi:signal transduction histidine kinase